MAGPLWFRFRPTCYKRCDFRLIGSWISLTSTSTLRRHYSQQEEEALMRDPFLPCSTPLKSTTILLSHRTRPCSLYPVRWRDLERDGLGLLGEIFRSRSRAVPFLAEQGLIGCAARSLATHVGPPALRSLLAAVALSGSICPSSTPATSRRRSSGQARAAHTCVEFDGQPDVNTVAKRTMNVSRVTVGDGRS